MSAEISAESSEKPMHLAQKPLPSAAPALSPPLSAQEISGAPPKAFRAILQKLKEPASCFRPRLDEQQNHPKQGGSHTVQRLCARHRVCRSAHRESSSRSISTAQGFGRPRDWS